MPRQRRPNNPTATPAPTVPTGLPYGARKQLEQQTAVAPTQTEDPAARQNRLRQLAAPAASGPEPDLFGGVFGPTRRPNEPGTAGIETAPTTDDAEIFLRVAYQHFKDPAILRLLRRR